LTQYRIPQPQQGHDEMPLDNAPLGCDWARIGKCLCSSMMAGPSLVQCRADGGCCRFLHHMCQTEWESEDSMREAHGNRNLCAFHHPALAGLHTTLGVEVNAAEPEENVNDCETEWLCDTNKSVRQVYQQTVTPTTDGNHTLPSTTVVGDLVFDLALLMTMGTGALDDNQMQTERINEFIEKGWLKKRSVNATKEMFKMEILRRHDILCKWNADMGDSIASTIGAISKQVQQIMNSFDMTQQKLNDEKMILRCEDHLRQAKQLKYSCEDDYLRAKIEHNKMERCEDPDVGLYFEVMNMKKARMIDAEAMIAKWESRIRDLGEKDHDTSSLPDQGLDNSGTLDVLANLAITDMIFTDAANNSINDDDDDVGGEHDFGNELSIDQINDVVDNIHQEDD
jgi:hypothetical protein